MGRFQNKDGQRRGKGLIAGEHHFLQIRLAREPSQLTLRVLPRRHQNVTFQACARTVARACAQDDHFLSPLSS